MTREDAILCLKGIKNLGHDMFTEQKDFQECIDMAIKVLEQESCEDSISRQALIERINNAEENFKADHMESSEDEDPFVDGVLSGVFNVRQMVAQAPSVTPTHIETVTEFADRCVECGKQKKGEWIDFGLADKYGTHEYKCTNCNNSVYDKESNIKYHKYCLHCGSRNEVE